MVKPKSFQKPPAIEARLVTKTSLPKPKEAIALLLLLWFSHDKPAQLVYGCEQGVSKEGGIYDENISLALERFASDHGINLSGIDLEDALRSNPLVTSQIESLNAAFELVWHLASFRFPDGKTLGSERTGGTRYRKRIDYGSNVDYVDVLAGNDADGFASVLFNWLTNGLVPTDNGMESSLVRALTLFAESALYKTSKGKSGIVYSSDGIYEQLLVPNERVELVEPGEEAQGPTRILKAAINDQLSAFLCNAGNGAVAVRPGVESELSQYSERVRKGLELSNVQIEDDSTLQHAALPSKINESRNLIFFGAPGTGKSYQLNKQAIKTEDNPNGIFPKDHVRRVTFYPDYQYAQFVGSYRPFSKGDKIGYHYIAGPFLETYLDASTHPNDNYLLIVEEINRANPAAVFGDVFQLLDRNSQGTSEYQIAVPAEMAECIRERLNQLSDVERKGIEDFFDPDMNFEEFKKSMMSEMDLPQNMFIWATMNSADQGVFPMDTAFKRRWDFRYIGIDDAQKAEIDGELLSEKVVTCGGRKVYWNELRKAINTLMTKECKINEDKLLGPFFLRPDDLADERFGDAFKDKVLMYLYEDAGKMKRRDLFWDYPVTYSQVCAKFGDDGVAVFGKGFNAKDIWVDKEVRMDDDTVLSGE